MNERKQQQGTPNPDRKDSGGQQQQTQSGEGQQYGEGNYKATRQYNEGMKHHVENHDIEKEARDAAPKTAAEEREMEAAEREGRRRAKPEGEEN